MVEDHFDAPTVDAQTLQNNELFLPLPGADDYDGRHFVVSTFTFLLNTNREEKCSYWSHTRKQNYATVVLFMPRRIFDVHLKKNGAMSAEEAK